MKQLKNKDLLYPLIGYYGIVALREAYENVPKEEITNIIQRGLDTINKAMDIFKNN